ncbi:N-6 DNA methylase [Frankia sp. Cpl3]|nr:N-6 DNA methylase [Frankia sp. Cpl3]
MTVWQRRHADFPRPEADGETERFRLSEMLAWLAGRPVPAAQRLAGEPDGVTYADRVRRAAGPPHGMASGSGASAGADTSRSADMSRSAGTGNGPGSAGGAGMRPGPRVDDTLVKEILTELFGPLGRRIRGGASGAAYLHLVVGLLFLRHRNPPSWARLRDEVRAAVDEQSDPRLLMGAIGRRVDAVRLDQQRRPATETAVATFSALGGRAVEDVGQLVRLCEALPPTVFSDLLGRYDLFARSDGLSSTTPRSLVELVTALAGRPDSRAHVHDPYARAGELLVGAREAGWSGELSGAGPDQDLCRLAEIGVNLGGGQATLTPGSQTPWQDAPGPPADLILTNPPFNTKSVRRPGEHWLLGPPPPRNDNYAWPQHVLALLRPGGRAVMLMPNLAAVSDDPREELIRRRMIEAGSVEFVVALPRQLFATTRVPVMLWGLRAPGPDPGADPGPGREDVLFVEVRGPAHMVGNQRVLTAAEIGAVAACHRRWQEQQGRPADLAEVMGEAGAARAVPKDQIMRQGYSLDPAVYLAPATSPGSVTDVPSSPAEALADQATAAHHADRRVANITLRSCDRAVGRGPMADGDITADGDTTASDLPAGWSRVVLRDLCTIRPGPSNQMIKKVRSGTADGTPVVQPRDLRDRRIRATSPQLVTREAAAGLARFALRENDILFVRTGSVGPVARVGPAEVGWLLGTNLLRLRARGGVDPGYLLALLSSRPAQEWISRRSDSATAIPSISSKALGSLPVSCPPLDEQWRIGAALAAVDDQIAAHRALADAAEKLRADAADHLVAGRLIPETLPEEPR